MKRAKVCIIFGTRSFEHRISIRSARSIFSFINKEKFEPVFFYVSEQGDWFVVDEDFSLYKTPISLSAAIRVLKESDLVFPVVHGRGEDGIIQGFLDFLDILYVGCDHSTSAICFDKDVTKKMVASLGIPVLFSRTIRKEEEIMIHHNDLPVFVKPSCTGSSLGMTIVKKMEDVQKALDIAFPFSEKVLIEKYLEKPRELEAAVLETRSDLLIRIGEVIPGEEYYSYHAKYAPDSLAKVEAPAKLDQQLEQQILLYSQTIFRGLGLRDMARIDFFVDKENNIFMSEINTIPGFTSISLYPMLFRDLDWTTLLLEQALTRGLKKPALAAQSV